MVGQTHRRLDRRRTGPAPKTQQVPKLQGRPQRTRERTENVLYSEGFGKDARNRQFRETQDRLRIDVQFVPSREKDPATRATLGNIGCQPESIEIPLPSLQVYVENRQIRLFLGPVQRCVCLSRGLAWKHQKTEIPQELAQRTQERHIVIHHQNSVDVAQRRPLKMRLRQAGFTAFGIGVNRDCMVVASTRHKDVGDRDV